MICILNFKVSPLTSIDNLVNLEGSGSVLSMQIQYQNTYM